MNKGCDDDAFNHTEILCQVSKTYLISNHIAGRRDSLVGSG